MTARKTKLPPLVPKPPRHESKSVLALRQSLANESERLRITENSLHAANMATAQEQADRAEDKRKYEQHIAAMESSFAEQRAEIIRLREQAVHIRIHCPQCHNLHVDEPPHDKTPHRAHACQFCGNVWTPSLHPTVGVRFLPGCLNTASGEDTKQ